ncbi:transcription factor TFIIIC subunit tfc4 [Mycoemilia scoparia]|uniref:Transcription factor TFIIIC subunit tfc4 n=1 Tax=Mycoemilia scoparia TaxID=417184 RepID=A0A9W7ZVH8_9FUNG|nr:transcription factor TFIIIC subunit tfc4 [Mycoemilia scoparia]
MSTSKEPKNKDKLESNGMNVQQTVNDVTMEVDNIAIDDGLNTNELSLDKEHLENVIKAAKRAASAINETHQEASTSQHTSSNTDGTFLAPSTYHGGFYGSKAIHGIRSSLDQSAYEFQPGDVGTDMDFSIQPDNFNFYGVSRDDVRYDMGIPYEDGDDDEDGESIDESLLSPTLTKKSTIGLRQRTKKMPMLMSEGSEDEYSDLMDVEIEDDRDEDYVQTEEVDDEDDEIGDGGGEESDAYTSLSDNSDGEMDALFTSASGFDDIIREFSGIGRKTKKKSKAKVFKRAAAKKLSQELQILMGEANKHYVNQEFDKAVPLLQEVIRQDPKVLQAWNTLALIREEEGNIDLAIKIMLVAAHLTPRDGGNWKRVALLTLEQAEKVAEQGEDGSSATMGSAQRKLKEQALYCLTKSVRADVNDLEAWKDRTALAVELEEFKAACEGYKKLIKAYPHNLQYIREAAPILVHHKNSINLPIKWIESVMAHYDKEAIKETRRRHKKKLGKYTDGATVPLEEIDGYTYSDINILIEMRMMKSKFEEAIVDIKRGSRFIQGRGEQTQWDDVMLDDELDQEYLDYDPAVGPQDGESMDETTPAIDQNTFAGNPLPIELRIKLAQCRIMLGQHESGKNHINYLYRLPIESYSDLYYDLGETLITQGQMEMGVELYKKLDTLDNGENPEIWPKLASCFINLEDYDNALYFLNRSIESEPGDIGLRLDLCELYVKLEKNEDAQKCLHEIENIWVQRHKNSQAKPSENTYGAQPELWNDAEYNEIQKEITEEKIRLAEMVENESEALLNTQSLKENADEDIVKIRKNKRRKILSLKLKARENERRRHMLAKQDADMVFMKIKTLEGKIHDDEQARRSYCIVARRLFDDWRTMPAFYTSDRSKPFTGYRTVLRNWAMNKDPVFDESDDLYDTKKDSGGGNKDLVNRYQRLLNKIKVKKGGLGNRVPSSSAMDIEDRPSNSETKAVIDALLGTNDPLPTTFRGYSFDEWFKVLMNFAITLALSEQASEACSVLETLSNANVFYHNPEKLTTLKIMIFLISTRAEDFYQAYEAIRYFCGNRPTHKLVYRIYSAMLSYSTDAMTCFASGLSYKFLRRQVTLCEQILKQEKSNAGEGSITPIQTPTGEQKGNGPSKDILGQYAKAQQKPNLDHPTYKFPDKEKDYGVDEIESSKGIQVPTKLNQLPPPDPRIGQLNPVFGFNIPVKIQPNGLNEQHKATKDDIMAIRIVSGNITTCTRSYMFSTMHYTRALAIDPDNSTLCLSLGLSYISRAMTRKSDNRQLLIMQGYGYIMRYAVLRNKEFIEKANQGADGGGGDISRKDNPDIDFNDLRWIKSQEVAYNVGRSFHQLNLNYLAVRFYERALELSPLAKNRNENDSECDIYSTTDVVEIEPDNQDICREAAYNLANIYTASGAMGLAQILLERYCVI